MTSTRSHSHLFDGGTGRGHALAEHGEPHDDARLNLEWKDSREEATWTWSCRKKTVPEGYVEGTISYIEKNENVPR